MQTVNWIHLNLYAPFVGSLSDVLCAVVRFLPPVAQLKVGVLPVALMSLSPIVTVVGSGEKPVRENLKLHLILHCYKQELIFLWFRDTLATCSAATLLYHHLCFSGRLKAELCLSEASFTVSHLRGGSARQY